MEGGEWGSHTRRKSRKFGCVFSRVERTDAIVWVPIEQLNVFRFVSFGSAFANIPYRLGQ